MGRGVPSLALKVQVDHPTPDLRPSFALRTFRACADGFGRLSQGRSLLFTPVSAKACDVCCESLPRFWLHIGA
jgi:hypothetical protein